MLHHSHNPAFAEMKHRYEATIARHPDTPAKDRLPQERRTL
jgi:hypothetical protein